MVASFGRSGVATAALITSQLQDEGVSVLMSLDKPNHTRWLGLYRQSRGLRLLQPNLGESLCGDKEGVEEETDDSGGELSDDSGSGRSGSEPEPDLSRHTAAHCRTLLTTYYSLLTTYYLLLTTYYLLLTTYYSLLTTHYSLLTAHYLLLTTHYPLLTTHYSLLTTHYSLLTTHCSLLTTYYSLLTTHYSLLTTYYLLLQGTRLPMKRRKMANALPWRSPRRTPSPSAIGCSPSKSSS